MRPCAELADGGSEPPAHRRGPAAAASRPAALALAALRRTSLGPERRERVIRGVGVHRREPQHVGQLARRLALPQPVEVGRQRDHIAAAIAGREVGPAPGARVDAERTGPPVGARRVSCDPLGTLLATVRQPAVEQRRQDRQRCGVDAAEVERAHDRRSA